YHDMISPPSPDAIAPVGRRPAVMGHAVLDQPSRSRGDEDSVPTTVEDLARTHGHVAVSRCRGSVVPGRYDAAVSHVVHDAVLDDNVVQVTAHDAVAFPDSTDGDAIGCVGNLNVDDPKERLCALRSVDLQTWLSRTCECQVPHDPSLLVEQLQGRSRPVTLHPRPSTLSLGPQHDRGRGTSVPPRSQGLGPDLSTAQQNRVSVMEGVGVHGSQALPR